MTSERQEELAALHALGLLEEDERRAFAAALAADPTLQALADSLATAGASLAATVAPSSPPAALRARVLAAVEAESPRAAPPAAVPFPWSRYLAWSVAAVFALGCLGLARLNLSLRREVESLRTQQRLAEIAYETARNQLGERTLLAEKVVADLGSRLRRSEDLARLKVSALASLAGNTAEAQAIAVWDPDQQEGLLTFENLPAIDEHQDYQIWVIDPAYPNPVNGGVFHVARDGASALAFRPDQPVARATAFAISLERKGGVPKAEGPIVLLGKLPDI